MAAFVVTQSVEYNLFCGGILEDDSVSDLEIALIAIKIVWIQMFLIITDKSNNKEVLLESYI